MSVGIDKYIDLLLGKKKEISLHVIWNFDTWYRWHHKSVGEERTIQQMVLGTIDYLYKEKLNLDPQPTLHTKLTLDVWNKMWKAKLKKCKIKHKDHLPDLGIRKNVFSKTKHTNCKSKGSVKIKNFSLTRNNKKK